MSCNTACHLCDRLIISESVAYTAPNLIIDLPAGSYNNGEAYCIVVAQAIPTTTTITAPVFITIGGGTELYPLTNTCCAQVNACSIRTRTRYKTRVSTTTTGGSFRMLSRGFCNRETGLPSIDGTAPA